MELSRQKHCEFLGSDGFKPGKVLWGQFVLEILWFPSQGDSHPLSPSPPEAPYTLDSTQKVTRNNGARSHFDSCCLAHCLVHAVWTLLLLQWGFRVLVCFASRVASGVHMPHPHWTRRARLSKLGRATPCNNSSVHIARPKQRMRQEA